MYAAFQLTLVVTQACNLRCSYCYTGRKYRRQMTDQTARRSIDAALASLHDGGTLELGFFGGEPLLQAAAIRRWIEYSQRTAAARQIGVMPCLTTNGTVVDDDAWSVMCDPAVTLSVSHDGLPAVHDRHRMSQARGKSRNGSRGTCAQVETTLRRLLDQRIPVNVIMVVRPDTVGDLADGLRHLHRLGVTQVTPSLDLWTQWTPEDAAVLEAAIGRAADFWQSHWPQFHVSWFDDKAGRLLRLPRNVTARCGFGQGQVAVSPSGRVYPCERLVGEDRPDNPHRLLIDLASAVDFLHGEPLPAHGDPSCQTCLLQSSCGADCRCSNVIRTGDPQRPDGLLCLCDQWIARETCRAIRAWAESAPIPVSPSSLLPLGVAP